jgi:hypothetical protein
MTAKIGTGIGNPIDWDTKMHSSCFHHIQKGARYYYMYDEAMQKRKGNSTHATTKGVPLQGMHGVASDNLRLYGLLCSTSSKKADQQAGS